MTPELAAVVALAFAILVLTGTILRLIHIHSIDAEKQQELLRSVLLLQKSETLEQFAAVEARSLRTRLDMAGDIVERGEVSPEKSPREPRKPTAYEKLWVRPSPPPPTASGEEVG